jgi:hypothetical protein
MNTRLINHACAVITACVLTFAASAGRAEEPAATPLKVGPLTFSLAAPWKVSDTPKPMSQGTIELPGKDGAVGLSASFYHFGAGQGGDLQGNIQRWQGMFQPSPEAKTVKEEMDFGKAKATLVSITGTYVGSRFTPEKEPRAGYTLLAAVLPTDDGDIYVRLVGSEAGVAAAKEEFKKFLLTGAK